MKKNNWLIWTSIVGFGYYFHYLSVRILQNKKLSSLWFDLWAKTLVLSFFCILIPLAIIDILIDRALTLIYSEAVRFFLECVQLICIYFSGVYATYRLIEWEKKANNSMVNRNQDEKLKS